MFEIKRDSKGKILEVLIKNNCTLILYKNRVYSADTKTYFSPCEIKNPEALAIWWAGWKNDSTMHEVINWCGGAYFYRALLRKVREFMSEN